MSLRFPLVMAWMLVAAAPAFAAGAAPSLRPGLWEVRVESRMEGMSLPMPVLTKRHCVTEQDRKPLIPEQGKDCKVLGQKMEGNTFSWRVRCRDAGGSMEGTGRMVYAGDRYHGSLDYRMTGGQMDGMRMRQEIQGRRLGDCQ